MSEFDKIIGYASIKEELSQLCDIIHNMEIYKKLGVKMPKGLLLHGEPGVGKSLMARAFLKESNRKAYIIRRNKPDGDFIDEIKSIFTEAAQNAPSIILLDDMDSFVVEEDSKEEYVAVQACIDEVACSDVYVVATANNTRNIPKSLLRAGRFDRKIELEFPKGDDALSIIRHYMSSKAFVGCLNMDDVAKMLHGNSCAEIETILNEAAIYAGFERSDKIFMEHIIRSLICSKYGAHDTFSATDSSHLEKVSYHEAGHVVVSEILRQDSIGFACAYKPRNREIGGFVVCCDDGESRVHRILKLLAGRGAIELKYGMAYEGDSNDLERTVYQTREMAINDGMRGIAPLNVTYESSEKLKALQEDLVHAEMERYLSQAKEMLANNMGFLDAMAAKLLEKNALVNSEIRTIRLEHEPLKRTSA